MKKLKEIVLYLVFGVLTTLVSWGTYTLYVSVFKLGVFWSNLFSWICAIAFAYVTNKLWVFESKVRDAKGLAKELASFVASRGVTGVIEIAFVPLVARLGFDNIFYSLLTNYGVEKEILFTEGIYSKVSVAIIVVILNYIFSKLFVFKKDKK